MEENTSITSLVDCEHSLHVHSFQTKILDTTVFFQVIKLNNSFHLFVGNVPTLQNMAMSMNTKYENVPTVNHLFGNRTDSTSSSIAQKLAKKTGKQVFVSCNLEYNQTMLPLVEKHIFDELKAHPDKF
ncbi:proteasome assembly chaperone 4-like [Gigantopelta aegis]|uniref:proteasome assembly chaperone 4-like n=1 Tax=Gigantopelta aegis TaxID=1735272 RepID=UPI001B88D65C|nr:proteasome assembly chaperone 4-like [Gigantopelta aegis]